MAGQTQFSFVLWQCFLQEEIAAITATESATDVKIKDFFMVLRFMCCYNDFSTLIVYQNYKKNFKKGILIVFNNLFHVVFKVGHIIIDQKIEGHNFFIHLAFTAKKFFWYEQR